MSDFIDLELPEPKVYTFVDRPPRLDAIVDRCKNALKYFKQYAHVITCSAIGHALAVVWSMYPSVKLEVVHGGYAQGLSDKHITTLEEDVSESAIKLADNLELFGDTGNGSQ